jgi:hypothetical protein
MHSQMHHLLLLLLLLLVYQHYCSCRCIDQTQVADQGLRLTLLHLLATLMLLV